MGAPQQLRQDAKRTNSGKRRVPALSPLLLLFLPSSQRVALALIACCCHSAVHAKGSWTAGVAYTGEVWSVVSGGLGDDMRSLANLDLTFEADLEDAIGWTGATVFAYGLYNNDSSISELAGDVQTVSNIETGVETFRLYEAWLEQRVGEKASIKIGLYDLNSEFDALETAGLFINSAHGIGSDIGLTGENGPSIFPVTSLGARLEYGFASDWAVR
ncbi:MAG: carbohydrate porin, partial [Sphingomonadales bacterium]|nr:carbohydrate porin [Sphingomonadales bacterium]